MSVVPLSVELLKQSLQFAYNAGAFLCPLAGQDKPDAHVDWCQACRVRAWLTPGHFLKPETSFRPDLVAAALIAKLDRLSNVSAALAHHRPGDHAVHPLEDEAQVLICELRVGVRKALLAASTRLAEARVP